jgi:hypothetical protein
VIGADAIPCMGSMADVTLDGDAEPSTEIVGDGDRSVAPEMEDLFFGFRVRTLV